jgi:hypothetical protein
VLEKYVAGHPREARPAHRVNLGDDEMNSRDRQAYRHYQEYFDIPYEV